MKSVYPTLKRYTWTLFLESKSDAFSAFKKLARRLQNTKNSNIGSIRSDHGGEFQNEKFSKLCEKMGILHNFSAPRTPQQNGVVERKNRSLEELARTMLSESSLPKYFWADAVSTYCYVMNRVLIRPILKKTPYELFNGRKRNISHLKVFGCSCIVLNNGKESLGKFDEKADLGIFICYSLTSHAYRVYNKRLMTVEESVHVVFDEVDRKISQIPKTSVEEDELSISLEKLEICAEKQPVDSQKQPIEILQQSELPKEWRIPRDLLVDNIIRQIKEGVSTRSSISNFCRHTTFVSQIELILPVDQNARALPRQRYLPMDRLCTTLASILHTSINLKNLQKTEWRRCGRLRFDTQVSDGTTKTLRERTKNSRNRAKTLSITLVFSKRKEVF